MNIIEQHNAIMQSSCTDGKFDHCQNGYPLFYHMADGGILCPSCMQEAYDENLTSDPDDKQWYVVECSVNWEDTNLTCEHCNERIESAYGDA